MVGEKLFVRACSTKAYIFPGESHFPYVKVTDFCQQKFTSHITAPITYGVENKNWRIVLNNKKCNHCVNG